MESITQNKNKYLIIIIVIIIVLGVGIFSLIKFKTKTTKQLQQKPQEQILPGNITPQELKKYKVPEKGEKIGENIAAPIETAPSAPKSESSLRNFEIKGENKTLTPTTFIVYQNDILNIKLTAIDQDYDFNLDGYNISMKAKKGETKTIEFQAVNLGKFNFRCSLCQTDKPIGTLIVVPKK